MSKYESSKLHQKFLEQTFVSWRQGLASRGGCAAWRNTENMYYYLVLVLLPKGEAKAKSSKNFVREASWSYNQEGIKYRRIDSRLVLPYQSSQRNHLNIWLFWQPAGQFLGRNEDKMPWWDSNQFSFDKHTLKIELSLLPFVMRVSFWLFCKEQI